MEKQRKFYLVLPLLVIPFLTMAFWALGGGRSRPAAVVNKGLDTGLPQAQFRKENEKNDKLAVYQQAQQDSSQSGVSPAFLQSIGLKQPTANGEDPANTADQQTRQIEAKLATLNQKLEYPSPEPQDYPQPEPAQVRQLQKLVNRAGASSIPDPEMRQLSSMLDKIQAIQNPQTAAVKTQPAEKATPFRAIPAIIDGKQRVADGAAVKLKLTDSVTIKNQLLPKGQELFGSCQITNQRLLLTIRNIRLNEQIIPVNLTVYSEDGMPGIPAPEAELSGVAGSNADQALQSMQLMSMDQSIGAQAAASGINAAKDLFSKKVKKIKVKLKNEYPVLLKNNDQTNNGR